MQATTQQAPKHWTEEEGALLRPAIERLLSHRRLSIRDIIAIRNYLHTWIAAPGWSGPEPKLSYLRKWVRILGTEGELRRWLNEALELGVDPL